MISCDLISVVSVDPVITVFECAVTSLSTKFIPLRDAPVPLITPEQLILLFLSNLTVLPSAIVKFPADCMFGESVMT